MHSTAEYCAPAQCRSANTCFIDLVINNTSQTIIGCICSTPADNLDIFVGIQPAELCHKGATISLSWHDMEPGHLLHLVLICPSERNAQHLKSKQDTHLHLPPGLRNQRFLGGVGFLATLAVGVRFFRLTPDIQLD